MAAPSPPVLPVSTAQPPPPTAISSATSQPPIATPAFRAFITQISDFVRNGLSQRRPWSELADRSAFNKPESFSDAAIRVRRNYAYFRVNYLAVIGGILAFSLLTNPLSLLLLFGLLCSWFFLYLFRPSDQPLVLFGRQFSDRETLGLLIVSSLVVIFLTSVGSVLISALMIGSAIVCAHGAFRDPEDLFMEEQEPGQATGLLSFLNFSVPAAPAAGTRV
ncbi:prenylated RAB acceptor 1.B4 [Euphorbia peplus]|nr:prenylated RAB acceptor 1.B4 [Euphorbia peplus]